MFQWHSCTSLVLFIYTPQSPSSWSWSICRHFSSVLYCTSFACPSYFLLFSQFSLYSIDDFFFHHLRIMSYTNFSIYLEDQMSLLLTFTDKRLSVTHGYDFPPCSHGEEVWALTIDKYFLKYMCSGSIRVHFSSSVTPFFSIFSSRWRVILTLIDILKKCFHLQRFVSVELWTMVTLDIIFFSQIWTPYWLAIETRIHYKLSTVWFFLNCSSLPYFFSLLFVHTPQNLWLPTFVFYLSLLQRQLPMDNMFSFCDSREFNTLPYHIRYSKLSKKLPIQRHFSNANWKHTCLKIWRLNKY